MMKLLVVLPALLALCHCQKIAKAPIRSNVRRQTQNFNYKPASFSLEPLEVPKRSVDPERGNVKFANTVRSENDILPDGSFNYLFETDNGIFVQAQGTPKNFGGDPPQIPVTSQGTFSWTSPEGKFIQITYTADENGYKAFGDAIPAALPATK